MSELITPSGREKIDDSVKLGEELKRKFGKDVYHYRFKNHVLELEKERLLESMQLLRQQFRFIMLLDICGVDNSTRPQNAWTHGKRFECVYHLLNMETHQRLRLIIPLDEGEEISSVSGIWRGAEWFEREAWDMFGINFSGQHKERLLTHHEFVGHPLRKDYETRNNQRLSNIQPLHFDEDRSLSEQERSLRQWVNLGPVHPSTRGTLRVMLELDGQKICRVRQEIGYLHRCFEKLAEEKMYNQIIPYTDRLNFCSAAMNNIGWCKTIEDLMEIEIPDRAKALRMVVAELSRIIDHLFCIGTSAVDAGVASSYWFCFDLRERIYELFEKLCGARITVSLTRIGGMAYDLPIGWISECLEVLSHVGKAIEDIDTMLTRSQVWVERTRVCPVSAHEAIAWGYTGPCLRACGVNYDIRKVSPYYFYEDVKFEIPLGINGDAFDRYLVRMEEIRQSMSIINQVLDNLPSGPIQCADKQVSLPKKEDVYTNIESLMSHYNLVMKGLRPPPGEVYSATEAANGELGFFVISDGGPRPYRLKVRPPCFPIYQSFGEVVQGSYFPDALVTLGSFNVVAGELDR